MCNNYCWEREQGLWNGLNEQIGLRCVLMTVKSGNKVCGMYKKSRVELGFKRQKKSSALPMAARKRPAR